MDKLPFEDIKREILVKKETETSWDYGKDPEKRDIEELINYGIVNINKSSGPTSHQVSDYVQRILGIKKSGHSGTLDPGVTGVLPIALEKATRIVQTLLKSGKEYVCLMYVHKQIFEKEIKDKLKEFTGKIKQLPPIRSAVKRRLRTREVYYINILEMEGQYVLFKVGCEAGTYIRKLVHDFGKSLNSGAHMVQLIRTKAGPFNDSSWHSLHDLKDAYEFYKEGNEKEIRNIILPIEMAVEHLPKIWVHDSTVNSLCHGASLNIPGISKLNNFGEDEVVAVLTLKNELIGLGISKMISEEILEKEKGFAIKMNKIFMDRNIYGTSQK
jgi:H/ACA ribonucleoprotein complex subunit 4